MHQNSIRTTNWNNMNKYKRTVRTESLERCLARCKYQDKIRLVQRCIKRLPPLDLKRAVVVASSRGYGKTTTFKLQTRYISLWNLRTALVAKDRNMIRMAINQRINLRANRSI